MRDTRKPVNYLQDYFKYQSKLIEYNIDDINSGHNNEEQNERLLISIFNSKVRQLVVAYSLGKNKEELTDLYMEFLDLLEKYNPELDKGYVKIIWLVSLGFLLEIPSNKMLLFKEKVILNKYNDFVITTMFNSIFSENNEINWIFMDSPYSKLQSIIEAGVTANIEDLKTYLEKDWYKAHSFCAWHNTLARC